MLVDMCVSVTTTRGSDTTEGGQWPGESTVHDVFLEWVDVWVPPPPDCPAATALLVPLEKGKQCRFPQGTTEGRQQTSRPLSWKEDWNLSFPEFKAQRPRNPRSLVLFRTWYLDKEARK